MTTFKGTSGDDILTGGAGNDVFRLWQGGNDTVDGGGGHDVFKFGAAFTADDKVDGGTGKDTLVLKGDYSAGVVFTATTMVDVETVKLLGSFDYNLTTNDATVAAGQWLTVQGQHIGKSHGLTFDGSAETDGHFWIVGALGTDNVTGGAQRDIFHMEDGQSNDSVNGGGGNDTIYLGINLGASSHIDGGSGDDFVDISGTYGGPGTPVTLTGAMLTSIDDLYLEQGTNYYFNTDGTLVPNGSTMFIDAGGVAANTVVFDGSLESGSLSFIGGGTNDTFLGGSGNDDFQMGLTAASNVDGGAGNDLFEYSDQFNTSAIIQGGSGNDTLNLDGNFSSLTIDGANVKGIETLGLVNDHEFDNVSIVGDLTSASGTLTIDASAAFVMSLDLSAATSSNFDVTGSNGDDTVNWGTNFRHDDVMNGGAGNDTVHVSGFSDGDTITFTSTTMTNVENLVIDASNGLGVVTADATVASGQTMTVDASAATNFTLDASAETNGFFDVTGGAGDDDLTGGAQADTFDLTHGGTDTVHGGDGGDTIDFGATLTNADSIDGGAGTDTVNLDGDYSGVNALVFTATTLTNVEFLNLAAGNSYDITTADGNVAAATTMIVDGSALGAGDTLAFDGSAETAGGFVIIGGAGDDVLTGGNGSTGSSVNIEGTLYADSNYFNLSAGGEDTAQGGSGTDIFFMGGAFDSGDTIDGGAGVDRMTLDGDYTGANAVTFGATTMTNVEVLGLAAGNSYDLTTNDATVGLGETLTVDALALGASDTLTFNGAAETDGQFFIHGGAGDDNLTGGALADTFDLSLGGTDTVTGGAGGDTFNTDGVSADTFVFTAVADSSSINFDTITNVNFDTDQFKMSSLAPLPSAIDTAITTGSLNTATFDSDLSTDVFAGNLGAGHAVLFTADAGDFSGHTFLIVDINFIAGYQNGSDLVIDVTGYTGTLTTGDFI